MRRLPLLALPAAGAWAVWLCKPDPCSSGGGTSRFAPAGGALVLWPTPDATWGMHAADANIALRRLVRRRAARYARTR